MPTVKFTAPFGKDEERLNGFADILKAILKDWRAWEGYAVVRFDCSDHNENKDTATDIPVLRILHIEPVDGAHEQLVRAMLRIRHENRVGESLGIGVIDGMDAVGDALLRRVAALLHEPDDDGMPADPFSDKETTDGRHCPSCKSTMTVRAVGEAPDYRTMFVCRACGASKALDDMPYVWADDESSEPDGDAE